MGSPIMDGLFCFRHKSRVKRAWLMGRATFWFTWRHPLPDGARIGFWYSLRAAWEGFYGEWTRPVRARPADE